MAELKVSGRELAELGYAALILAVARDPNRRLIERRQSRILRQTLQARIDAARTPASPSPSPSQQREDE